MRRARRRPRRDPGACCSYRRGPRAPLISIGWNARSGPGRPPRSWRRSKKLSRASARLLPTRAPPGGGRASPTSAKKKSPPDGEAPLADETISVVLGQLRFISSRKPPQARELAGSAPDTGGEPGERGRADGRGLALLGHLDGKTRQVGQELHQERVASGSSVGAQALERERQGIDDVSRLERGRFERCPYEMLAPRPARDSRHEASRLRNPVRRAEARERRNEVDASVVLDGPRELLALRRRFEESETVTQPLKGRPGDEHRALDG